DPHPGDPPAPRDLARPLLSRGAARCASARRRRRGYRVHTRVEAGVTRLREWIVAPVSHAVLALAAEVVGCVVQAGVEKESAVRGGRTLIRIHPWANGSSALILVGPTCLRPGDRRQR